MKKLAILALALLIPACGGKRHSSAAPAPPPPSPAVYANDTSVAQTPPIRLGTSGGNATDSTPTGATITCCSGTLGCLVRRDGDLFILSNSHVLARSGQGAVGDPVTQPGLIDNQCRSGAPVATLAQSAPIQSSNVDAALARVVPGTVDPTGAILDLGPAGASSIDPAPPSATLADPAAVLAGDRRVAKTGRSTGLTCATLLSINTDVSVDYSATCDGPVAFTQVFRGQLMIDGADFSAAGDSGSLIVTSGTSRPLGLLYGGGGSVTVANPIAEVLNALKNESTGEVPEIVGGGDHPVSCAPVAPVPSAKPRIEPATAPSPQETARAGAAKDRQAGRLLEDPAVVGVAVGTSADQPAEGALLVYVRGAPRAPLPAQLDGVRTRIVRLDGARPGPVDLDRADAVKARRSAELLDRTGVVGVGVGRSEDAEGEPALVVYVERGAAFADAAVDGLRTRVIEVERFRTFGWGRPRPVGTPCCGDAKK